MLSGGRHQGTCLRTSELGVQAPESPGEEAAVKGSGSSRQVSDTERERDEGTPEKVLFNPCVVQRRPQRLRWESSPTAAHPTEEVVVILSCLRILYSPRWRHLT